MEPIARTTVVRCTILAASASLVLLAAAPASAVVTPGSAGTSQVYLSSDDASDTMALTCTAGQVRYLAINLLACSATTSIQITGAGGNDAVDLSALQPGDFPAGTTAQIDTGLGSDTVKGSQMRDEVDADNEDTVQGLGGNDRIQGAGSAFGGDGDDLLDNVTNQASGGAGDDVISQPSNGPFDGGPGYDAVQVDFSSITSGPADLKFSVTDAVLHLESASVGVSADISSIGIELYEFSLPPIDVQDWDSSTFSGAIDLKGLGGTDRIVAGPGEDFIDGGTGDDELTGGTGFDYIVAGAGNDQVFVRDGQTDRVLCGDGADTVTADATDVLTGCETVLLPEVPVVPPPTVPPTVPPVVPPTVPPAAVAPDTGAITGPKKVAKGRTATFKVPAGGTGLTYQCKLDAGAWKTCTSPYKVRTKKLKLGKHQILIRAVRAGLVDATPTKKSFKVVRL